MSKKAAGIGDNASQQNQEQSAKYLGGVEISGYVALTRPKGFPSNWREVSTADTFKQISTNIKKVKTKECQAVGKYPVIDQGQLDVAGFVDDISRIIEVTRPLVIFGDHTRIIKWVNSDFVPGADGTKVLEAVDFIEPRYFYYQLKSIELPDKGYSRHFRYLNETSFRVAPIAEQQQIAAKLDELLAQVDSVKTRLDAIPKILKRFRQSVLAAAVSGKLTEDWRLQYGFEIQSGSDPWSKHNFGDLYQLIDGDRGPNYPKQSDYSLNGDCLFLSTKNVRPFGFLFDDPVYISEHKHKQLRNGALQVDDVVITTRGTLGNVAVYDSLIAKRYPLVRINSGMLIIREKNSGTVLREYLKFFIASPHFADQLTAKQTGSAQPQIPAGVLKTFSIGVPKLEEQQEIVRRVEQLFTCADQIEQRVKDAQARVNHLTQAILAKAFRGELTADWRAQNPDLISGENSAEALLQRIKAEREAGGTSRKSKKV